MNKIAFVVLILSLARAAQGQVDIEQRRTLMVQTGFSLKGEEQPGAFGYYWFNENHYPWTNTALRVIFAGIFADGELSWFLPANTNVAIGVGLGGGLYINSITPYQQGEFISSQQFYGDVATARAFVNETIPNPTPLPINLRATYSVAGAFFRETDSTSHFILPDDFMTHSLLAEVRFGGIEPGLTARRGAELYLGADVDCRSGFEAFGPTGATFPAHSQYGRLLGSLAGKIPVAGTVLSARLAGGHGDNLNQLSAWKIGGNLFGTEPFTYPLHGYYTREFFAADFGLANLDWAIPILDKNRLTGHFYGDWAVLKPVPPEPDNWHNYFGVGAGLGLRAWWNTQALVSYGYGINAVRDGRNGGHEVGLGLEKKF